MSIGINLGDEDDDIGPLSHWNDDEFDYHRVEEYINSKENILKGMKSLSKEDRKWVINKLKESKHFF